MSHGHVSAPINSSKSLGVSGGGANKIVRLQVASIMVPLLKFFFHEDVRRSAVQSLPEMLESANQAAEKGLHNATKQNVKQLLDYFWPALIEGLLKVCLVTSSSRHLKVC